MVEYNTRVKQKSDTSLNWSKATNFIPLQGEIIIYSDTNQIKIGDGTTKVNELKFIDENKQDKITGAVSSIASENLATDRVLISDTNGKVAVADVTVTELSYLGGVTSNIQEQLNSKLGTAPVSSVNNKTGAVSLTASDVGAVGLTGNETVAGEKTFNGGSTFNGDVVFNGVTDFSNTTVTGLSGLLPAVTASDNGQFLRVADGAWAATTVANANGVSF